MSFDRILSLGAGLAIFLGGPSRAEIPQGSSPRKAPFEEAVKVAGSGGMTLGDLGIAEMENNLAALDLMQASGREAAFRTTAAAVRKDLQAKAKLDPSTATTMMARLDELLARKPVPFADADAIYRICMESLSPADHSVSNSPARNPAAAWAGLKWINDEQQMTGPRWKEAFELLRQKLPDADLEVQKAMASLVSENPVANEHLDDEFLMQAASGGYPGVEEACMERLAAGGHWKRLIQAGETRDIAGRVRIFRYFCLSHRTGNPQLRAVKDPAERDFLNECLTEDFWGTMAAMSPGIDSKVRLQPWLATELRESLQRFLNVVENEPWPDFSASEEAAMDKLLEASAANFNVTLQRLELAGGLKPPGETDRQNRIRREVAKRAGALYEKSRRVDP